MVQHLCLTGYSFCFIWRHFPRSAIRWFQWSRLDVYIYVDLYLIIRVFILFAFISILAFIHRILFFAQNCFILTSTASENTCPSQPFPRKCPSRFPLHRWFFGLCAIESPARLSDSAGYKAGHVPSESTCFRLKSGCPRSTRCNKTTPERSVDTLAVMLWAEWRYRLTKDMGLHTVDGQKKLHQFKM